MTKVQFYDNVDDQKLKFAVIVTKTNGHWVFCKHKERNTLEVPGGHREPGEDILATARRELYEETGAVDFSIEPVCVYSVTASWNFDGQETFGMLFYADVKAFEKELHSEIERIVIQDDLPTAWTYPEIQPYLMQEVSKRRTMIVPVVVEEVSLTDEVLAELISLSKDWEAEKSCYGYRANQREDIEGNRIFLAREQGRTIGYLFGKRFQSENMRSIMPEGSTCFEVEEVYVIPSRRSTGIGKALFEFASDAVQEEAEYITLSTATKNWKAIFHFYLDELDMTFWSARLFKRIRGEEG
ncbi:MAG: GNAT family N-acetyltransferase [Clostridia bacterium]|nr:GNAT family N-acetyltransferase [Clostridia bacterium]